MDVTFEENGGSEVIDDVTDQVAHTLLAEPEEPTKEGYIFGGWYTDDGTFKNRWDFAEELTRSMTLYARWLDTSKEITAFDLESFTPKVTGTVYEPGKEITLIVPFGTDVTSLTPTITHTGISVSPASGAAINFINPVTYTVTAEDGSQLEYTVTVSIKEPTDAQAVAADKESLAIGFASRDNADSVTQDVYLLQTGTNGTTISWISDNSAIAADGTVNRPSHSQGNAVVALTAAITKGDASDTKVFQLVVVRRPSSHSRSTHNEPAPTEKDIEVIVNGQKQAAGTETVRNENGRKIVELRVDADRVNQKIEEVLRGNQANGEKRENRVEVPVEAGDADRINSVLTGDIVRRMEQNDFTLSIKTPGIGYNLPAGEVAIAETAQELGVAENDLDNIEVVVRIEKADDEIERLMREMAAENDCEIVVPPVNFKVVAKTKSDSGERETTISRFSQYVERVVQIPEGVDPSKITTGIIYNADGTFSHVPTEIFVEGGIYYAKINSLTNSDYSVIWNPVTVASVVNHWSKVSVNDMASRLVIKNPQSFLPDEAITRGDFAEYITKALGVYRTNVAKENLFTDVTATDELADAVTTAVEYNLIKGYPDGTFKPAAQITREEAMTMYARAMDIIKLAEADNNRISTYRDASEIAVWAYDAVKKTVSAGVFNGRTKNTIVPKGILTRAEAATAIRNLLIESGLINE